MNAGSRVWKSGLAAGWLAIVGTMASRASDLNSDGGLGNQTDGVLLVSPWSRNLVYGSTGSQSPFTNVFANNGMGVYWATTASGAWFSQNVGPISTSTTSHVYANLDVMLPSTGGFRPLLCQASGVNPSVLLHVKDTGIFAYSLTNQPGAAICAVETGEWYNIQLTLDLKANTYSGAVIKAGNSLRCPISTRPLTYADKSITLIGADHAGLNNGGCRVDNWLLSDTPLPAPPSVGHLTRYVAQAGQTPGGGYLTWATAASNIQDAVDAAAAGEVVLVSNGVYNTGGVKTPSYLVTNRLVVDKAVAVRSVNGPEATIIEGVVDPSDPVDGLGANAVRCVYLRNGASLAGFTLTNGRTLKTGGHYQFDRAGGGAVIHAGCVVSNCVLTGNKASDYGGGAYLPQNSAGTLVDCTVRNNATTQWSGGVQNEGGTIRDCVIDGNYGDMYCGGVIMAFGATLSHCVVSNNSSRYGPGGVYLVSGGTIDNCLVANNAVNVSHATANRPCGIWLDASTAPQIVDNCTIANNRGKKNGGGVGFTGGSSNAMRNCIVWGNTDADDTYSNVYVSAASATVIDYTCSGPAQTAYGAGNIGGDPRFADAGAENFHLKVSSPCINHGLNTSWMTNAVDLDGTARIKRDVVDMGCYETDFPVGTAIVVR
ncbi:MAG: right-handed parallel beta-helix repeat-containing protein [Kiritimatiellae bacterium]|nr:right-handed parallel beta-helix repeat-containing protein [Kiritimatiellia bacterium]